MAFTHNGVSSRRQRIKLLIRKTARLALPGLVLLLLMPGISRAGSNAEQRYYKGIEYASQGEFEKAEKALNNIPSNWPNYDKVLQCLRVIEDTNNGKTHGEAAMYLFKGAEQESKGQYNKAIHSYSRAIELDPDFTFPYNNRGILWKKKGDYDKAIADYRKAINLNPSFALFYYQLANALDDLGRIDEAIQNYTRAIDLDPSLYNAYNNRGLLRKKKGEYDKAISDYVRAIKANEHYGKAYDNMGIAFIKQNDVENACQSWRQACELGECRNFKLAKRRHYCE